MAGVWLKIKHRFAKKKLCYDVSGASRNGTVTLTSIQKYDPLEDSAGRLYKPLSSAEQDAAGRLYKPLSSAEQDAAGRLYKPLSSAEQDAAGRLYKPLSSAEQRNGCVLQTQNCDHTEDCIPAKADHRGINIRPAIGIPPNHDRTPTTEPPGGHITPVQSVVVSSAPPERSSTVSGCSNGQDLIVAPNTADLGSDDDDFDPAYSTLADVHKKMEERQWSLKVVEERPLRNSCYDVVDQRHSKASRSSEDSGLGSPGQKSTNRNQDLNDVFVDIGHSHDPVEGRNSVSEFPTYDNWVIKQESSKSSARKRTGHVTVTTDTETESQDNGEIMAVQSDEVYAIPHVLLKQTTSLSIDSVDGNDETKGGDCDSHVVQSGTVSPPPIPIRGYERTNSIVNMTTGPAAITEFNKVLGATIDEEPVPSHVVSNGLLTTVLIDTGQSDTEEEKTLSPPLTPSIQASSSETALASMSGPSIFDSETALTNHVTSSSLKRWDNTSSLTDDEDMSLPSDPAVDVRHPNEGHVRDIVEEPIHMTLDELRSSTHGQRYFVAQDGTESGDANTRCIQSLDIIKDCGWYWGPLSATEAEEKLEEKPDGAFLVRDSSDECYILSLTFRTGGVTRHTRIEHHKGTFSFYSQPKSHEYGNIKQFIENAMHHSRNHQFLYFTRPRGPGNPPIPVSLTYPVSRFKTMRSLQHMCRFSVLRLVRRDHIGRLPLPNSLKNYLREEQYYVEFVETWSQPGWDTAAI